MLIDLFLGFSRVGAQAVLVFLLILSVVSIALILERWKFYRAALQGTLPFRRELREHVDAGRWDKAYQLAQKRVDSRAVGTAVDFDSAVAVEVLAAKAKKGATVPNNILHDLSQASLLETKVEWESKLSILATIGSNAPFVGLFGTVLGIIEAFHYLSKNAGAASGVTSGIAEALVATAVGIFVAIPAVVAYNSFQRKVRRSVTEAEALRSYLLAKIRET